MDDDTIYFFSAWAGLPHTSEPKLFWASASEAEAAEPGGAAEFIEKVIMLDPKIFVAMQTVKGGVVPTCLCCHSFGERHQHMATLFHWDAMALRKCKPGGVVSATEPAPLDADDIEFVFAQLSEHPDYHGQKVISISKDHEIVELCGDEITRLEPS